MRVTKDSGKGRGDHKIRQSIIENKTEGRLKNDLWLEHTIRENTIRHNKTVYFTPESHILYI